MMRCLLIMHDPQPQEALVDGICNLTPPIYVREIVPAVAGCAELPAYAWRR
jgi:hypothetical protein